MRFVVLRLSFMTITYNHSNMGVATLEYYNYNDLNAEPGSGHLSFGGQRSYRDECSAAWRHSFFRLTLQGQWILMTTPRPRLMVYLGKWVGVVGRCCQAQYFEIGAIIGISTISCPQPAFAFLWIYYTHVPSAYKLLTGSITYSIFPYVRYLTNTFSRAICCTHSSSYYRRSVLSSSITRHQSEPRSPHGV